MKLNKDELISVIGEVAVLLGASVEKKSLLADACFNSMVRSNKKADQEENNLRKDSGIPLKALLNPEDSLVNFLESLPNKVFAKTILDNINPFVEFHKSNYISKDIKMNQEELNSGEKIPVKRRNPLPEYVPDPEFRAQTKSLREMTDVLNASLTPPGMDSLVLAEEIVDEKGRRPIVYPSPESSYFGKVLGLTDQHVVVSLGRSSLIVDKSSLDRVPKENENIDLKFINGRGVLNTNKSVDLGR